MISRQAEVWLNDLYAFSTECWGLELHEQPHRKMVKVIEDTEFDDERTDSMLVVPRGTYKTSITRAALVWKQLRQIHLFDNPYHRIAIASATLPLGKAIMTGIANGLNGGAAGRKIAETFGILWQNKVKTFPGSLREDGIYLAPRIWRGEIASVLEPNFWVASIRRISTGFHADELVCDDLNNDDNSKTDHRRQDVHQYWSMLFPILGSRDRAGRRCKKHINATPYHDDDVRGRILRNEREKMGEDPDYVSPWRIMHSGAILEDGSYFFPEKLGPQELEKLRNDPGMLQSTFASQYLCDPVGENGFVDENEIRFKSRQEFPALRNIRITVDPNQHKDAIALGCYAAIVVSGYDRFANLWVLDARGSRAWNTNQFIDALFEVQEDYPDAKIFMEDSHMAHFQHAIQLEEATRSDKAGERVHLRINYVPIDVQVSKYNQWERIRPRFKNHSIWFAEEIGPTIKTEVKEELVRGKAARFKDFLDALSMAETGVRPKIDKRGERMELDQPGAGPTEKKAPRAYAPTWEDVLHLKKRFGDDGRRPN